MEPAPHAPELELPHGTLFSYALGFILSVLLTLVSFLLAPHLGVFARSVVISAAVAQLFVQLIFFLHLGRGKGGWNGTLLSLTGIVILIVMGGTLRIMSNLSRLHAHAPTPADLYDQGIIAPQNELR